MVFKRSYGTARLFNVRYTNLLPLSVVRISAMTVLAGLPITAQDEAITTSNWNTTLA